MKSFMSILEKGEGGVVHVHVRPKQSANLPKQLRVRVIGVIGVIGGGVSKLVSLFGGKKKKLQS